MILQPVVENAIQYGIRNISWEGWIRLYIEKEKDYIRIQITDNGCGITKERLQEIQSGRIVSHSTEKDSNGIGLGNVQERLRLYYNMENLFSIESEGENMGTSVTISIPQK